VFKREWAPKTRKGYLADVRGLFRFAVRRGWLDKDVSGGVELPSDAGSRPPDIHTPEQVRTVL
jgi:site-specific recombinase XerD